MSNKNEVVEVTDLGPLKQNIPVTTFIVESIEQTIEKIEAASGKVYI